jgi:hypothetical protein
VVYVSSGVRRNEEGKKEGGSRVRVVQHPRDRARAPRVNERLRIRQILQKSGVAILARQDGCELA